MSGAGLPFWEPHVEISLDNLAFNYAGILSALDPGVGVMAVVKDSAYGCGSVQIGRALETAGAAYLAVARVCEAQALRRAGVDSPVLVLGPADREQAVWASGAGVTLSVSDPVYCRELAGTKLPLNIHCEIDTGMGRTGMSLQEVPAALEILRTSDSLFCEGLFTHFACADAPDGSASARQRKTFGEALRLFNGHGFAPRFVHCANSAAVFRMPGLKCNLVRPGIALYGCLPDPAQDFGVALRPVAALKGRVLRLRRIPAGTPVSYGWTWRAPADTCIAVVGIGYGHGLPRFLSNRGHVLIRGRRFPIRGTVTMDYVMVETGFDTGIEAGDEAVAMGYQDGALISPDEIALAGGTIGYEILCGLNPALHRIWVRDGTTVCHSEGTIL